MPAIESIAIKGFKSIREVEVKLRDINVLIGANGSGKSNFLEVFSFLQDIRGGDLSDRLADEALRQYTARAGGAGRLLHFGPKFTDIIYIGILFAPRGEFSVFLSYTDTDSLLVRLISYPAELKEQPPVEGKHTKEQIAAEPDPLEMGPADGRFSQLLATWRLYHFHDTSSSAPLKKTANLHDNRYLRPDGSNLAAFLYLLREKHEDSSRRKLAAPRAVLARPLRSRAISTSPVPTSRRFYTYCAKNTKIRTDSCGTPYVLLRRSSTTSCLSRLR